MAADEDLMRDVYVQPGESHLVREPTILRTVLGSCVGVTFRYPKLGVAALCHPMLPCHPESPGARLEVAKARRYVDFAIRELAKSLDALGARRNETEVKIFGGADVIAVEQSSATRATVGRQNADRALQILEEEGYHVIARRLGGRSGCHIDFDTSTGEVLLRSLG
jgi:chemotaxis protein CheD